MAAELAASKASATALPHDVAGAPAGNFALSPGLSVCALLCPPCVTQTSSKQVCVSLVIGLLQRSGPGYWPSTPNNDG